MGELPDRSGKVGEHAASAVTMAPAATAQPFAQVVSSDALAELLARDEASIRRVIAGYVGHASTIDDLYQESVLKCLRRLGSLRDPATLRGWVYQTVRNACIDHLRRQAARPAGDPVAAETLDARGDQGRGPADQLLSRERLAAIERCVDALPPSQREAIRLRVQEGLDHTAIAERLGISREAVEVRLCKGRTALKAALDAILGGDA